MNESSAPIAIGYARCSTDTQEASGLGLDAQRSTITSEVERRGWTLSHIASDVGSGKSLSGRQALAQALLALDRGDANVLVVARLDRLSRSVADFAALLDRAKARGWSVLVADLGIDMATASGEMMANILATFAQFERRLIAIRTAEALQAKRAGGARLGRPRTMDPDVERMIVAMSADGRGLSDIARHLNETGVPTTRGGRWHPSTIRAALRSARLDAEAEAIRSEVAA